MVVPIEQFVKQLEDIGILAGETIKDFMPPNASPIDAKELAKELVRRKKLTTFQAEEVYRGKGMSLLLGNYVLMEEIGAGGMGQVFKAQHRRMNRLVAIKLLPPATMKDKVAIERFEREIKASAKISHPNVVAAYDSDCANGVHFLVMELVEGKDLAALVKRNGPFSISQAVNCVLQAARGLEVAHKKGIIHRDIKPNNLLMDTEGTVKILDMGLARLGVDVDGNPQADLTSTGTIMGTVDYMAPEQALDTKTADARADVYALGCSMFYLLTGKATYDGDTIMKKLLAHREQPIPSLVACRPDASQQLDAVFQKMVAKKLEDRYQSMSEVIADLEPLEAGNQPTVTIQRSASINLDNSANTGFTTQLVLQTIRQSTVKNSVPVTKSKILQPPWKNIKILIGAALFGALLLAGIVISLDTKDGKLIVEVDQPDAMVQVLDLEGKVEISQKGGGRKIVISVDPGKHWLKVVKDGFTTYGQEFELEKGGKKEITAKLMPLEEKPTNAGTQPTPEVPGDQTPLFFQTPTFEPWAVEVAALPAEKQIEAVAKKLMELNSGFDGTVAGFPSGWTIGKSTPKIENGVVTEIGFVTDNVTDISPVRALVELKAFWCADSGGAIGKLSDLSPLRGMVLTKLTCSGTRVSDLLPLQGMPLFQFMCDGTNVESLSPLQDMSLTYLNCGTTLVSDLSPLSGMPLTMLWLYDTKVSDLEPLRGMKLTVLDCNTTQVTNLSPLVGMTLEKLHIHYNAITDLAPLKEMPLKTLQLGFNPQRDAELLRSIQTLEIINGKPVAEFWREVEE